MPKRHRLFLSARCISGSRLSLVLGRGRRGNDRRIDDRAGLQQQPLLVEQRADFGKDPLGQLAPLQQVTESQNRRQ